MKKLMKAIAFATVMCMLLSVSAFASNTAVADKASKTIDVTVAAAAEGKQVALLIVDPKYTGNLNGLVDTEIYYIDQKEGVSGEATFTDISVGDHEEAAVWVGYDGAGAAMYAGNVKLVDGAAIKVELLEAVITKNSTELNTLNFGASAVRAKLSLGDLSTDAPAKAIWALTVKIGDSQTAEKRYSKTQDLIAGLTGDVEISAIFHNGSKDEAHKVATIEKVDVIILTQSGAELYSDAEDAKKKAN